MNDLVIESMEVFKSMSNVEYLVSKVTEEYNEVERHRYLLGALY